MKCTTPTLKLFFYKDVRQIIEQYACCLPQKCDKCNVIACEGCPPVTHPKNQYIVFKRNGIIQRRVGILLCTSCCLKILDEANCVSHNDQE